MNVIVDIPRCKQLFKTENFKQIRFQIIILFVNIYKEFHDKTNKKQNDDLYA